MRICMIEAAKATDGGSAGAAWVRYHAEQTGEKVEVLSHESKRFGYDIELISVHHQRDYERLVKMPKRGKIRIIGGHITYTNPRPVIPLTDVVCCGDGETWIRNAITRLRADCRPESLRDLPGTIISGEWAAGQELPELAIEKKLPLNPPHLNREGNHPHWNVEIARGCPYKCAYCEIGNTVPYRSQSIENIRNAVNMTYNSGASWLRLVAPEEGSHPAYGQILDTITARGLRVTSGCYRIEQILNKRGGLPVSANQIIRVGVDGFSESLRKKANKPISDRQILDFFEMLVDQGHEAFKLFQIFGYPDETEADFREWERLMNIVMSIPLKKSCIIEITWTPFVPICGTPFGVYDGRYNAGMAKKITDWHKKYAKPKTSPGWFLKSSRMISRRNHDQIVKWTKGSESLLLDSGAVWVHPKWRG